MIRELRHIHAFLAVARCGSFTRAAVELKVSQPALTVQVRQLESQLGVSLFDRNKRRVALTQAGRDLVAPLEWVIFDFESVIANTRDFVEHRRGIVAVGALPSVAAGLLPRAMKQLPSITPASSCASPTRWPGASRRSSRPARSISASAARCRPIASSATSTSSPIGCARSWRRIIRW